MLVKSRYEADTVAAITHESVRLAARTVALHVYRVICERDEIIIPRHIDDCQSRRRNFNMVQYGSIWFKFSICRFTRQSCTYKAIIPIRDLSAT